METLPSIFDLVPLEHGGPIARAGFLYQDHVAAKYCIEMLLDPALEQVWCETLDDITLIR
ncbi:dsDNA nuclease domain-containing protein [Bradyrhizobium sp. DASA03120]|uniref:dsDNA nuclease domain-containing protein n=1 Tax=Bradyrhizobium sp. SMVTL-02 TaxID=3395917 RepID=UPI003F6FDE42